MDPVILLIIFSMMALAGTLTIAVYRSITRPAAVDDFEDVLARVTGDELANVDTTLSKAKKQKDGKSVSDWWMDYWYGQVKKAGRVVNDPVTPGRTMLGVAAVAAFFGILVYPGGPGGVYLSFLALGIVKLWLVYEQGRRRAVLERQMPMLLSGLRTQMHAGVTVQGALMSIADDLPDPLGEEISQVKRDVSVGVPLDKSLSDLAKRIDSRLMQFLVSSIGVAIRSGSDLVPQLITIEEIVQQRARIQGKIRSAVALAKPTAYLAEAAPPAMFVWLAISDPTYLGWWFSDGLIFFIGVVLAYILGIFVIQLMVKNVEKT